MKKYKIIGLTFWTTSNVLLIWRLRDYIPIAPLFVVQIIISVCCSILFCIEFSSRAMRIVENVVMIVYRNLEEDWALYKMKLDGSKNKPLNR